jgi:polyisoprenoid-binding protein YceI
MGVDKGYPVYCRLYVVLISSSGEKCFMNRSTTKVIGGLVVVAVLVAVGVAVYLSTATSKPSGVLSAPTLAVTQAAAGTSEAAGGSTASSSQTVYKITPDNAEASFTLDEKLMGNQNTVVGKTKQIVGEILVDTANPANSKVGVIRISARDLKTDSNMRDGMMRRQILQSADDKFEFITFTPTSLTGLPATVKQGDTVNFKIAGDLTIRDITQPVTFDATATLNADSLVGSATTTVQRGPFKLEIPRVPSVTDVTEDVKLEIKFTATPGGASGAGSASATEAATQGS